MTAVVLGRDDLDVLDAGDVQSSKPAPDELLAAHPSRLVDAPGVLVGQL